MSQVFAQKQKQTKNLKNTTVKDPSTSFIECGPIEEDEVT